ncbi:MAG: hypothetical protein KIT17_18310 [Rubrivivax sp.]|nr:hypothetical protein [Rubrivivax sp.]
MLSMRRLALAWLMPALLPALLFAAGGALLPAPAAAEEARGRLVGPGWLKRQLGQPGLLLLDASMTPMHRAAHIPGAVSVDLYRFGPREASPAELERRLQAWGVGSPGQRIVVHDEGGGMMAPWLYFELLHAGVPAESLFLLDGGLHAWRAAGGAVTKEATPAPPRGGFRVAATQEALRVRLPEVLSASGDTQRYALIEALEPTHHYGEAAFFDRGGHIPHARMMPTGDFYNADKTFKSAEELRRMLGHLGVRDEQQVLTYCGGGVAATVPFFALRFIAGVPQVRVYKESQLEWLRDERRLPFWTYGAPYLMRDSQWLAGWAGRMARAYGIAQVSLVDVRSPEAFRRGHLPFALNVPAAVFREHARDPAKLGDVLAKAGVKATDEAVVFSDAGLDADAATAWLLLERLGQKKVSVFVDSLERWAELGHEVARVAPASSAAASGPAGAASAPPVAPPVRYEATPRPQVVLAQGAGGTGAMPRVFVASGRDAPAGAPVGMAAGVAVGKVLHLPPAEGVGAGGVPKAAKDLWKAIAKAGVPRYAEIVLFADDLGDAAANRFLLTLMGFPDVKVLVP